tara:strand:- start:2408 stop:2650 length:243 start_codon:yes stop_codon:yes gene_type:complete
MISAQGDWVVLIYEHKISDSGIITNEGNSATVISVGSNCPDDIQELQGKRVVFSQKRTLIEIKEYMVIDWRDILYVEEEE